MLEGKRQPPGVTIDRSGLQWLLIAEAGVGVTIESSRRLGLRRTGRSSEAIRAELSRRGQAVSAAAALAPLSNESARAVLMCALHKARSPGDELGSMPSFCESPRVASWDESSLLDAEDQLHRLIASLPQNLSSAISFHRTRKYVSFYKAGSVVSELRELWGVAIDFWNKTSHSDGVLYREAGGTGVPQLATFVRHTLADIEQTADLLLSPTRIPVDIDTFVLSAKAASIFFHEAIGHSLEQRHMSRALADVRAGDEVLPTFVNVTDDPTAGQMFGYRQVDDVGNITCHSTLIDSGRIYGCFADAEFSESRGLLSVAARWRQDPRFPTRSRMSNLVVRSGNGTIEEFIRATAHGCYVERASEGSIDNESGYFSLRINEAYLIVNGRRHERLVPFSLVGHFRDLKNGLAAISAESTDTAMYCSTGGSVCPTGMRAPGCLLRGLRIESD
ncbi:MAG: hypothetical protein HY855_04420 [Burkholderiales bacterium]|nr:hypothetical protein [Burkholderiales bacterium]